MRRNLLWLAVLMVGCGGSSPPETASRVEVLAPAPKVRVLVQTDRGGQLAIEGGLDLGMPVAEKRMAETCAPRGFEIQSKGERIIGKQTSPTGEQTALTEWRLMFACTD